MLMILAIVKLTIAESVFILCFHEFNDTALPKAISALSIT